MKVMEFLEKSARAGRISHAYLFSGSEYTDKLAAVGRFIEILKCDPIDYIFISPKIAEKGEIKKIRDIDIDEIRNLQNRLALSPFKSQYQVAVVSEAEKMTKEAVSALLKTLEEPAGKSIIILVSSFPKRILGTIKSRCEIIKFPPPPLAVLKTPVFLKQQEIRKEKIAALLKGDLASRFKYAENLAKDALVSREELNDWLFVFRDAILSKINCERFGLVAASATIDYSLAKLLNIAKKIKETEKLLANPSINSRLAIEVLMLEF